MLTPNDLAGHLADHCRLSVAVIGAGAAGAMAARTLADQGHEVRVYEKSRGAGGRMATRRAGELQFDHGAQYFTLRDPRLHRLREAWAEAGIIAPWAVGQATGESRWVGVPGMNALVRHLLEPAVLRFDFRVETLRRKGDHWALAGRGLSGELEVIDGFDALVVAIPAPQASTLLADMPSLVEPLAIAEYAPCWTAMAAGTGADPDLLRRLPAVLERLDPDGPLAWVAHDGGKPGRRGDSLVLQAGPGWSRAWLERDPADVASAMWDAFAELAGISRRAPRHLQAHRWRHARVLRALERECLWDGTRQLAACGDYCLGARVEAALLSGAAAAGRVMTWASGAR